MLLLTLLSCGSYGPNKVHLKGIVCARVDPNEIEAYKCHFGDKIGLELSDADLVLYSLIFEVEFVSDSTRTSLYHPYREGIDGLLEPLNEIYFTRPNGDSIKQISAPYKNWQNFVHEGICLRSQNHEYQCVGSLNDILNKLNETEGFMVWHIPMLFAAENTKSTDSLNVIFH